MYYIYVLKSEKDESLYLGYSSDLKSRIKQHNNAKKQINERKNSLEVGLLRSLFNTEVGTQKRETAKKIRKILLNVEKENRLVTLRVRGGKSGHHKAKHS